MAEIKTDPHEAHDPVRIEAMLDKQRKRAEELGLDEDQAELIWKTLIDWNVNYEKGIIVARRGTKYFLMSLNLIIRKALPPKSRHARRHRLRGVGARPAAVPRRRSGIAQQPKSSG